MRSRQRSYLQNPHFTEILTFNAFPATVQLKEVTSLFLKGMKPISAEIKYRNSTQITGLFIREAAASPSDNSDFGGQGGG